MSPNTFLCSQWLKRLCHTEKSVKKQLSGLQRQFFKIVFKRLYTPTMVFKVVPCCLRQCKNCNADTKNMIIHQYWQFTAAKESVIQWLNYKPHKVCCAFARLVLTIDSSNTFQSMPAVSYTHLDVYKRQEFI